jgi:XTP/dITP diphosphohydrolase
VLGLCDASGARVVEGRIRGTLAREPRGANGFGWDAIFIPDGDDRTFGEMTASEKSAISHRRRAWDALRDGGSD